MDSFKDRLITALNYSGVGKKELADAIGVTPSAITQWLTQDTNQAKPDNLFPAAEALRVRAEWLGTGRGPMLISEQENTTGRILTKDQEELLGYFDQMVLPSTKESTLRAAASLLAAERSSF